MNNQQAQQLIYKNDQLISQAIQSVELVIPGVAVTGQTATTFSFTDQPYLRPDMAYIQAIECFTLASITNAPMSGNALPSLAVMQKSFLTLYGSVPGVKQGNEIVQRMPLLRLNNMQNATPDPFSRNLVRFRDLQVDWTKSFVTMPTGPGNTVNWSFVFDVYFNFVPGTLMNDY